MGVKARSVLLDALTAEEELANQMTSVVVTLKKRQVLPLLEHLLSEEDTTASYDAETDQFYVSI
ncbi:hypothetical protein [Bradyrhizobium daqingense]|uniref:hypothetical protein n=1 Tax=Bradyrhizobium daqingense TaxID=993502 RepID=UPI0038382C13